MCLFKGDLLYIQLFLDSISRVLLDRLCWPADKELSKIVFPVDWKGGPDEYGHDSLMEIERRRDGQTETFVLHYFDSTGYGALYELTAEQADMIRGSSGKEKLVSIADVIAEGDYHRGDKRVEGSAAPRMTKVPMETGGHIGVERNYGIKAGKTVADAKPFYATKINEKALSTLLCADKLETKRTADENGEGIAEILASLGADYTTNHQRIHAVQREGTCEMKSLLAFLSHRLPSEILYQAIRLGGISRSREQIEKMTEARWEQNFLGKIPDDEKNKFAKWAEENEIKIEGSYLSENVQKNIVRRRVLQRLEERELKGRKSLKLACS